MCPPAACTWLMQLEYAECGGCHFEIVVPEIAHWTSPTVCGSSVWIAPSPKVIPGPTPLALSFGSPSGSTATCQPPSFRHTSRRGSLFAPLLTGTARPSMFDWPARTKTCAGISRPDPADSAAVKTAASRARRSRMRGNRRRTGESAPEIGTAFGR